MRDDIVCDIMGGSPKQTVISVNISVAERPFLLSYIAKVRKVIV